MGIDVPLEQRIESLMGGETPPLRKNDEQPVLG